MGFFNKLWSGLDFWDRDENRSQREQFAREEEEKRRSAQVAPTPVRTSFRAPTPGPSLPAQSQQPFQTNNAFDPASLIKDSAVTRTGFNNPILEAYNSQTPEQKAEAQKKTQIREELDRLTQDNLEAAKKQASEGTSWFSRNISNRGAVEENAQVLARVKATRQYQDTYGWNTDPTVLEFSKNTSGIAEENSRKARESAEKLDRFADKAYKVGEYASYVPVTGSVMNLGLAGADAAGVDGADESRMRIDAGMTMEQFNQLDPEMQQKIRNMQKLGLALSPLDFIGTGAIAKSGVTATGKTAFKQAVKTQSRAQATRAAIQASGKQAVKEAALPTVLGTGITVGAQGYLGGSENINVLDAAKTGLLVGGTSTLFGGNASKKKVLDVDLDTPSTKLRSTAKTAADDTSDLPGTSRVVPDAEGRIPQVDISPGVKSAAKIPDPASPVALARPNELDSPIADFDAPGALDSTRLYHGSTNPSLSSLEPGALNGLNEKRSLVYLSDTPEGAAPYTKTRGDSGSGLGELKQAEGGRVYDVDVSGNILDGADIDARIALKSAPGYDALSVKSKNQLEYDFLGPSILEANPELSSFLKDNGYSGVRGPINNTAGQTEVALLDPARASIARNDVDPQGNPILKSDAQRAQELAEQGIAPARADSTSGAIEEALQQGARQDLNTQVANTDPDARALLDAVSQAEEAFDDAAKIRTNERGQRIAAAQGAYDSAGGGEAGYRAKLAQLKGKYSESGFEPVGVDEGVQIRMLDQVENSGLRDFEKLTAQRGLRKIWGAGEGKPVPSELNLIRKVFGETGDQIANQVQQAIDSSPKNWKEKLVDIAGIPRTAMTSFDLSMGLRQGSGVMLTNFKQWRNANKESVKYAFNSKYFDEAMAGIRNDDAYTLIADKMGVRLPGAIGEGAELVSSKDLLERVPVYGKGVAGSNRAYTGGLTKLRFDVAKKYVDSLGGTDAAAKMTDFELGQLGEVVNTFTGSGGKAGDTAFQKAMPVLQNGLFAPRLWASRLNMLNPYTYVRLKGPARKEAIKNMASFMSAASATVGLMKYAFGDTIDVETDPRSSDFMKIKYGNTRYDVFSGLQQNIVLGARLWTGEKKSSTTGELSTLADGFGAPTRMDVTIDALKNKTNPVVNLAWSLMESGDVEGGGPLDREDKFGNEFNIASRVGEMGLPLSVTGAAETYNDTGSVPRTAGTVVPGFFGIGTQTYGDIPTKDTEAFNGAKDLRQQRQDLEAAGIPMTAQGINDLAETGDYSNALRGAEYRLAELEADEMATDASRNDARRDIEDLQFGSDYGYIPSSEKAVQTRAENGDYEAAIAGWKLRLDRDVEEGNTPASDIKKQEKQIARYEVYKEAEVEPQMVIAYEKRSSSDGGVGVTAWREMMESGDPELVAYAEKLYNLDQMLVEAGIVEDEKYYWRGGSSGGSSGSGSGGSGRSIPFETNIGTLSPKGYSFSPQQLKKASYTPAATQVPQVPVVPGYSRKKKQISVTRGRVI